MTRHHLQALSEVSSRFRVFEDSGCLGQNVRTADLPGGGGLAAPSGYLAPSGIGCLSSRFIVFQTERGIVRARNYANGYLDGYPQS